MYKCYHDIDKTNRSKKGQHIIRKSELYDTKTKRTERKASSERKDHTIFTLDMGAVQGLAHSRAADNRYHRDVFSRMGRIYAVRIVRLGLVRRRCLRIYAILGRTVHAVFSALHLYNTVAEKAFQLQKEMHRKRRRCGKHRKKQYKRINSFTAQNRLSAVMCGIFLYMVTSKNHRLKP